MSRENEARPSGRASVAVAESVTKVSGLEGADTPRRGSCSPSSYRHCSRPQRGLLLGRGRPLLGDARGSGASDRRVPRTRTPPRQPRSGHAHRSPLEDGGRTACRRSHPSPAGRAGPMARSVPLQAADRPGVPDREGRPRLPPERAAAAAGEGGREGRHAVGEGGDRADQRGGPAWPAPHVRDAAMRDRRRPGLHGLPAGPHRPDVHDAGLHRRHEAAGAADRGGGLRLRSGG